MPSLQTQGRDPGKTGLLGQGAAGAGSRKGLFLETAVKPHTQIPTKPKPIVSQLNFPFSQIPQSAGLTLPDMKEGVTGGKLEQK